jgi:hypothetical protein
MIRMMMLIGFLITWASLGGIILRLQRIERRQLDSALAEKKLNSN